MTMMLRRRYCKNENIRLIFIVLLVVIQWEITSSHRCRLPPVRVPSCPKSTLEWSIHADEFCTDKTEYHCLATEEHNPDNPNTGIIECCMSKNIITRGYFPRYNTLKNEIQEQICSSDYYMPTNFDSNRFLDNGPGKCKYKKSECSMEGMLLCSEGSIVEDRKCMCNYKNKYSPVLSIPEGGSCFYQKDNFCEMDTNCSQPHQELNMLYECVNKCLEGQYRPEDSVKCVPLPATTVATTNISSEKTVIITSTRKTLTTTSTDPMVRPEITDGGEHDTKRLVIIAVSVVISLVVIGFIVIILVLLCSRKFHSKTYVSGMNVAVGKDNELNMYRDKKDKISVTDENNKEDEISLIDEVQPKVKMEIENPDRCTVGQGVTIVCRIKNTPDSDYRIHWEKKGTDWESIDISNSTIKKYAGSSKENPSLIIKNLDISDDGEYKCVFQCPDSDLFKVESAIVYLHVNKEAKSIVHQTKIHSKTYVSGMNVAVGKDNELNMYRDKKDKISVTDENNKEDEISLIDEVQPKVKMEIENPDRCTVGQGVTIVCRIKNTPDSDYRIHWEKKGTDWESIDISNSTIKKYAGSSKENPSLIIKNLDISDDGEYKCVFQCPDSDLFKVESAIVYLHVNKEAKSIVHQTKNYKADNLNFTQIGNASNVHASGDVNITKTEDADSVSNTSGSSDSSAEKQIEGIPLNTSREKLNQQQPSSVGQNGQINSIQELASKFKYDIRNVEGDGNCLFYAASEQMGSLLPDLSPSERAFELRKRIVHFLRENPNTPQGEPYVKWLHNESWEKFLDRMSRSQEYGNEIIVEALCHCFNINVKVLSTLNCDDVTKYKPTNEAMDATCIHLGHIHETQHYVILVPGGGNYEDSKV